MSPEYFQMESRRLREVLADAVERGDYYLEMDVREALEKLQQRYYNEDEQ